MFIDIHTHKFVESGNPAIRNLTFEEAEIQFTKDEKGLFSLGFHPWHLDEFSIDLMDKMKLWLKDDRITIIGECGLDKNSKFSIEKQLFVFEQQIVLSERTKKPMIIHCVGCFNELFELKKRINPYQLWIIHGFRGKPELAKQAISAGCELSFGEHFNIQSVKLTPLDHLFVETDESILSITEIYHSIAEIKKCNVEELNAGENLIKSFT